MPWMAKRKIVFSISKDAPKKRKFALLYEK